MNTQQTIKHLTDAIRHVHAGQNDMATNAILLALRSANTPNQTAKVKAEVGTAKKVTRRRKNANKRGPIPSLSPEQVAMLTQKVSEGVSIRQMAKSFGIHESTAHRYLANARKASAVTVTVK